MKGEESFVVRTDVERSGSSGKWIEGFDGSELRVILACVAEFDGG